MTRHAWTDPELNDFLVAATAREAFELHCAHIGIDPALTGEDLENHGGWPVESWVQLHDDRAMRIVDDEGGTVTKTCGEWAATEKPGYLAGTNY